VAIGVPATVHTQSATHAFAVEEAREQNEDRVNAAAG
jgi:hypothetical protein